MRPALRRGAALVVAVGSLTLALATAAPSGAQIAQGWGASSWLDATYKDEMAFTGDAVRLRGTFTYNEGQLGEAAITYLIVEVTGPGVDVCPHLTRYIPVGRGDGPHRYPPGEGPPATPTSPPSSTGTTAPAAVAPGANVHQFDVSVAPRCNGIYDISVRAVVDPAGDPTFGLGDDSGHFDPDEPDPFISPALELSDVRVGLRPPIVPDVAATLNSNGTVTVTWSAPPGYTADEAPEDFLGYHVQRADGEGDFRLSQPVSPGERSFVDTALGRETPVYRYRVLAVREGARPGEFAVSDPTGTRAATVAVPRPPATPTTARAAPPATRPRPSGTLGSGPTTTIDEGFDSTLPFDDPIVGPEDAVLPEDASRLLELDEEPDGSGILVPFATALVVLMWALHLRHLSRRASTPA